MNCWWPETIGVAKPTQTVSKSVRSAHIILSTKSAATNITREQFYDCALPFTCRKWWNQIQRRLILLLYTLLYPSGYHICLSSPQQPSRAVCWFSQEFVTCLIENLSQIWALWCNILTLSDVRNTRVWNRIFWFWLVSSFWLSAFLTLCCTYFLVFCAFYSGSLILGEFIEKSYRESIYRPFSNYQPNYRYRY